MNKHLNIKPLFILIISILFIDQFTKFAADTYLTYAEPVAITSFFNLTLLYNKGAAFSMLNQGNWQAYFLLVISILASLGLTLWIIYGQHTRRMTYALGTVLAGAIGNLIDRARNQYVIDFLDFYLNNWHWPAFNIADSAITIGAILLIYEVLKQ